MDMLLGKVQGLTMAHGSVGDFDFINNVINFYEIDTIFHFGAQSIVSRAELDPRGTFYSNIAGTTNILDSAKGNRVKSVVTVSSDKMYGHAPIPYKEDGIVVPKEVYSTSKTCSDFVTQCYGKDFAVPCIVIRPCNFFGPGDLNFSRLIPNSIIKALNGTSPVLWKGVDNYIREMIYTKDAVEIIVKLANILHENESIYGEAYNRGSGATFRVGDLIENLTGLIDPELTVEIREKEFEFREIEEQYLDLTKISKLLGDMPNRTMSDFDGCLRETIDWYRDLHAVMQHLT
jgi:CDP-glucose 4,6-dehydratase